MRSQMHLMVRRTATWVVVLGLVATLGAVPAFAQSKGKTKRAEGKFQSFDPATNTIVVNERGKEQTYKVKPEGSILTRTAVKINGLGGKVSELPKDARVFIYWLPDQTDPKMRFARTIDAPSIPKDLMVEDE